MAQHPNNDPADSDIQRWRRRILVIRFSALGDVAMTVPVLYSACRREPDTLFVLATKSSVTGLFVNAPSNMTVVGVDLRGYRGLPGLWRLSRELFGRYAADACADLHDVLRTKVIRLYAALHRIPVAVIDKDRRAKTRMTRNRAKELTPLPTSHVRYADTLRRLKVSCEPDEDFSSLYAVVPADPGLYARATAPRQPGEHWVGIAPFAAHRGKIYPPGMMRRVIGLLVQDPGTRVFVFGAGHDETAVIESWARDFDRVTSLASLHLGFAAELALMNALDVMLTMDSGNMHLAALTGTRVVSIWGATHPYCGFRGWGQTDAGTLQLALTCRPCSVYGNKPCARGDYMCLAGITPERVADAVTNTFK